jgi:hypothetical protein
MFSAWSQQQQFLDDISGNRPIRERHKQTSSPSFSTFRIRKSSPIMANTISLCQTAKMPNIAHSRGVRRFNSNSTGRRKVLVGKSAMKAASAIA